MAKVIEPLVSPPRPLARADDRTCFDCDVPSLNEWFERHAWRNHAEGISRTTVICSLSTGKVAGFVTLSSAQIERSHFAKPEQRNRPEVIPATLLGQLAIDRDHQGSGYADALLQYALRAALAASLSVASIGVFTHPIDGTVRAFYTKYGFCDLPFDPRRAMIVRMADIAAGGLGD